MIILSLVISLPAAGAIQKSDGDSLREASSSISYLRLKATMFTSSPNPLAIIEDTRSGQATMYELGDLIDGDFKIIDIARGEVSFKAPEGEFKLSFPAGAIWQPQTALGDEDASWYKISRDGDIFVTDQATVSNALRRIREIMKEMKVSPHFIDGEKAGIKVTRLTPVGILKEIGIKEGDVVKDINGLKLNTPYQIFNAFRKLRNQQELTVDIIRGSQPQVLTYRIEK